MPQALQHPLADPVERSVPLQRPQSFPERCPVLGGRQPLRNGRIGDPAGLEEHVELAVRPDEKREQEQVTDRLGRDLERLAAPGKLVAQRRGQIAVAPEQLDEALAVGRLPLESGERKARRGEEEEQVVER